MSEKATNRSPHLTLGVTFLVLGVASMMVLDPWYLGIVFLLIGLQRIYVALTMSEPEADDA